MTNNLNCPFCGAELEEFGGGDFPLLHYCDNTNCNLYHIMGQYTLWQALIDGKKAQDALKELHGRLKITSAHLKFWRDECVGQISDKALKQYISDKIDEIASITKQEKENG